MSLQTYGKVEIDLFKEIQVSMVQTIKNQMVWWRNTVKLNLPHCFRLPNITHYLETDSSLQGWGVCLDGGEIIESRFHNNHEKLCINSKELLAIYFAIRAFHDKIRDCHILLKCDNRTAISDFSKMGSMTNLFRDDLSYKIHLLLQQMNTTAVITYISSKENCRADFGS